MDETHEEDTSTLKVYLTNLNRKMSEITIKFGAAAKDKARSTGELAFNAKANIAKRVGKSEVSIDAELDDALDWDEADGPRYIIAQPNEPAETKQFPEGSLAAISAKAAEALGEPLIDPSVAKYLADAESEVVIDLGDLLLELGEEADDWGQITARPTADPAWVRMHRDDFDKIHRWIGWSSEQKQRQDQLFKEAREMTEMLINLEIISDHFEVRPNRQGKLALFAIKPIVDFAPRISDPLRLVSSVLSASMFFLAACLILDEASGHYGWAVANYSAILFIWPLGLLLWAWVITGIIARTAKGTALEFKTKMRVTLSVGVASTAIVALMYSELTNPSSSGVWNDVMGLGALMLLISGVLKGVGAAVAQRIDEHSRGVVRESTGE